jgi:hypothetical protein
VSYIYLHFKGINSEISEKILRTVGVGANQRKAFERRVFSEYESAKKNMSEKILNEEMI